MKKKCGVVMLTTKEKANIKYVPLEDEIGTNFEQTEDGLKPLETPKLLYIEESTEYGYPGIHLYILSDEEIKEGDWVLTGGFGEYNHITRYDSSILYYKKIIACTDMSLTKDGFSTQDEPNTYIQEELPQPHQSFIEYFVEEYNKGNVIKEVMVEYDMMYRDMTGEHKAIMLAGTEYPKLKVNPRDNTIYISNVENSYTKKDFMNAIHKVELMENKDYSKLWEKIEQNL